MITPVVSPAILREYQDVLARPELHLPKADVLTTLKYLKIPGSHVIHVDPTDLPRVCSDPDDDHFLAAAMTGRAAFIVTGNPRHVPPSPCQGIVITTPAAFLRSF